VLLAGAAILSAPGASAEQKQKFSIAWTIYAGWMPVEVRRRVRDHERSGPISTAST